MTSAGRNLRLWQWASPLGQAFFHAPVFFLYMNQNLSVEQVLQLEAAYYFSVVLCEVPSGFLSDRVGRILTLRISSLAGILAYGLFFIGGGFTAFLAAQVALAVHFSFRSGTDVAWHYELLEAEGRGDELARRESRLARAGFGLRAACALIGGAVGSMSLAAPYALAFLAAVTVGGLLVASREIPVAAEHRAGSFGTQLRRSLGRLSDPWLAWIFGYVVLQTTLEHIPYEFAQPYLAAVLAGAGVDIGNTPIATGVLVASVAGVGAVVAGWAAPLMQRFGVGGTLLGLTALQTLLIAALASAVHPVLATLLLLRSVQPAIGHVVVNASVAPRVPRSERATYLSIHSLAGRTGYGLVLLGLGMLAGGAEVMEAAELRRLLGASAALAAVGLASLLATRQLVRRAADEHDPLG